MSSLRLKFKPKPTLPSRNKVNQVLQNKSDENLNSSAIASSTSIVDCLSLYGSTINEKRDVKCIESVPQNDESLRVVDPKQVSLPTSALTDVAKPDFSVQPSIVQNDIKDRPSKRLGTYEPLLEEKSDKKSLIEEKLEKITDDSSGSTNEEFMQISGPKKLFRLTCPVKNITNPNDGLQLTPKPNGTVKDEPKRRRVKYKPRLKEKPDKRSLIEDRVVEDIKESDDVISSSNKETLHIAGFKTKYESQLEEKSNKWAFMEEQILQNNKYSDDSSGSTNKETLQILAPKNKSELQHEVSDKWSLMEERVVQGIKDSDDSSTSTNKETLQIAASKTKYELQLQEMPDKWLLMEERVVQGIKDSDDSGGSTNVETLQIVGLKKLSLPTGPLKDITNPDSSVPLSSKPNSIAEDCPKRRRVIYKSQVEEKPNDSSLMEERIVQSIKDSDESCGSTNKETLQIADLTNLSVPTGPIIDIVNPDLTELSTETNSSAREEPTRKRAKSKPQLKKKPVLLLEEKLIEKTKDSDDSSGSRKNKLFRISGSKKLSVPTGLRKKIVKPDIKGYLSAVANGDIKKSRMADKRDKNTVSLVNFQSDDHMHTQHLKYSINDVVSERTVSGNTLEQACVKEKMVNIDTENSGIKVVSVKHLEVNELKDMKKEVEALSILHRNKYDCNDTLRIPDNNIITSLGNKNVLPAESNNPRMKIYLNCWPKEWTENDDGSNQNQSGNLNVPPKSSVILLKSVPSTENHSSCNSQIKDLPLAISPSVLQSAVSEVISTEDTLKKERLFTNGHPNDLKAQKRQDNVPMTNKPLKMKLSNVKNPFTKRVCNSHLKERRDVSVNLKGHYLKNSSKSLAVKPAPKVLEDRKPSAKSDESKDIELRKPWPKNIRSYYGKTSYEMRQRYLQRYPSGPPDAKKLRMVDLIFYNPPTNPMTKKSDEEVISFSESNSTNNKTEEDVDDVVAVPQLKVGPEGRLIIDPKTVPHKTNEINRNEAVDNDYLKPLTKRKIPEPRRVWSHNETIKFYKALHTIGADFSVMSTLFPNRTRKMLKHKFKREEKLNGALIDKVLMNPASFDINALKQELEEDERKNEEVKRLNKISDQDKRKHGPRTKSRARFNFDSSDPGLPQRKKSKLVPSVIPTNLLHEESMQLLRACSKVSTGKTFEEITPPLEDNCNKTLKKRYSSQDIRNKIEKSGRKTNYKVQYSPHRFYLDTKVIPNADKEIKLPDFEGSEDSIMVFDFTSEENYIKTLAEFNESKRNESSTNMDKILTDKKSNNRVIPLVNIDSSDSDCQVIKNHLDKVHERNNQVKKQHLGDKSNKMLATKKRSVGRPRLKGPNKKCRPKCTSKGDNTPQIRNLQSIAAEGLVEEDIESVEATPQQKVNPIVINTNIVYNALNITRSVSYDAKNFNDPLDINTTIDHQPNLSSKSSN